MIKTEKTKFKNKFHADVYKGLRAHPKFLESKYFYDKKGDDIFQKIMTLPEYYLTDLEYGILEENKKGIAKYFSDENGFDLIELGAGDGKKTKVLLKYFLKEKLDFKFHPVDISENVLNQLSTSLKEELPTLKMEAHTGTYSKVLGDLASYKNRKKVILFLGSNIGNFKKEDAVSFLKSVSDVMEKGDFLFIGFDQKKDPEMILKAYNDETRVTEAFNKNLLSRINNEMEADFQPDDFLHWPIYDPETGTVKSFLISKKDQVVHISALDLKVQFKAWESIHTENSQKYDDAAINKLAEQTDLKILTSFSDKKSWYKDYILAKK